MPDCVLALDVGGTSVKLALADTGGLPIRGTVGQLDFDAGGTKEEILAAFRQAALEGRRMAETAGLTLLGLGVAFPGPFDFDLGMSRMAHKMPAIKDVPLTPVFQGAAGELPVRYLHDSTAYLLGEASSGAAAGASSPALTMLGTGFGFAYMRDGRVRVTRSQRPHIALWNAPFLSGTVEDYVSRRAIRARYAALAGAENPPDVLDIACKARAGEVAAIDTFYQAGQLLASILRPVLQALACDILVVGGQIARSADLFLRAVESGLDIPVRVARHLDDAALRGAARYCALPKETLVEEVEA